MINTMKLSKQKKMIYKIYRSKHGYILVIDGEGHFCFTLWGAKRKLNNILKNMIILREKPILEGEYE